jgi:peroxiredoxin
MKRRMNSNTWILIVLGVVLLLIGIDLGRNLLAGGNPEQAEAEKPNTTPDFKVGDKAPDFALPDEKGQQRHLHEVVKGDTILTFSCGCNTCKTFQTYLGTLAKMLGPKAPHVVSVNTTKPEGREAWVRDTKLKQSFLYAKSHTEGIIAKYHGHPCPRAFRLAKNLEVKWIGPSPPQMATPDQMGMEIAGQLGFRRAPDPDKSKPLMPMMDIDGT